MRRLTLLPLVLALAALLGPGCSSDGLENDPILRLSAEEALAEGRSLMDQEKYAQARKYLTHAFEVEPNSRSGREALLLAADTLFLQGGEVNYIQAEAKYRDFLNRFPTSDLGDYAQFQLANSLVERIAKPNRDQLVARQALGAYDDLLALYPTTQYAEEAQAQIKRVRANLAEHEFLVGHFYLKFRNPEGSVGRFVGLLEDFPDYDQRDKVLYYLSIAYDELNETEKAEATREQLSADYPDSEYNHKGSA